MAIGMRIASGLSPVDNDVTARSGRSAAAPRAAERTQHASRQPLLSNSKISGAQNSRLRRPSPCRKDAGSGVRLGGRFRPDGYVEKVGLEGVVGMMTARPVAESMSAALADSPAAAPVMAFGLRGNRHVIS
jgi:hypothetical protein